MTNSELIAELRKHDPKGDAQIFVRHDAENSAYYDIKTVVPIAGLPDSIIEVGELRCTSS